MPFFTTHSPSLPHRFVASVVCGLLLGVLPSLVRPNTALAWEPETTHAGLAETSAMDSKIHEQLNILFGEKAGLYAELGVPRKDAPEIFMILDKHSPSEGYTPDTRGIQTALSWLVAGAVLADTPKEFAKKHFFPASFLKKKVRSSTQNALAWLTDPKNPMGGNQFYDQFKKAVISSSRLERQRHLAGALLAAGAIHHVVTDMASPSHVRADLDSHNCLLYTSPSPRDATLSRMPSSA